MTDQSQRERTVSPKRALAAQIASDQDYAWSWHCNLAVPIMEWAGISHAKANDIAASLMQAIFGTDTRLNPNYPVAPEPEREAFEKAMDAYGLDVSRTETQAYRYSDTRIAWAAWNNRAEIAARDTAEAERALKIVGNEDAARLAADGGVLEGWNRTTSGTIGQP